MSSSLSLTSDPKFCIIQQTFLWLLLKARHQSFIFLVTEVHPLYSSLIFFLSQQISCGLLLPLISHTSLSTFNKEGGHKLSELYSDWQARWPCWVSS